MSCQADSDDSLLLQHYDCVASYHGKGRLTFRDHRWLFCRFAAGQLQSGEVILLCFSIPTDRYEDTDYPLYRRLYDFDSGWSPSSFCGRTADGQVVKGHGFSFFNYLTPKPNPLDAGWAAFGLREMSVQEAKPLEAKQVTYGLSNIEITGTEMARNGTLASYMPLSLEAPDFGCEVTLRSLSNRTEVMRKLRALRGMSVSAEATLRIIDYAGLRKADLAMDDLCCLLSIARGTGVQWLYRQICDDNGKMVSTTHYWRARASFCQLWAIQPRMMYGRATKDFVETAYPILVSRPDVYKPAINMYLDAKAEADSLEVRSAKMALAMEALKAAMLKHLHGVNEYIIPEQEFDKLLKDLESTVDSFLESRGLGNESRKEIVGQVKALNRTSFRRLIKHLSTDIGLTMNAKDLNLFIQCRNSLVHGGRFYCVSATEKERKQCRPKPTGETEYFFLVHFLDRIFLKLFGYCGPYMDWSSGRPEWKNEL